MMADDALDKIVLDLEKVDPSPDFGPLATEVAAVVVSDAPKVDLLLKPFFKKYGDQSLSVDLKDALLKTVSELQQIVPQLTEVHTLHEKVALLDQRKGEPAIAALINKSLAVLFATDEAGKLFSSQENTYTSEWSKMDQLPDDNDHVDQASGTREVPEFSDQPRL